MNEIYEKVADALAVSIEAAFASEDSLKQLHDKNFPGLEFDRTERWHLIFARELHNHWAQYGPVVKAAMTPADRREILLRLTYRLDFNLFSQVLLNLQDWGYLRYRIADVQADTERLQEKWANKSPSPFDAKAKMIKTASKPEDLEFNRDLSTLKSLRIIPKVTPGLSFRVSPKGSTPALVDSANLSMLGVGGDQYLWVSPNLNVAYLTWDLAPTMVEFNEAGEFNNSAIAYPFISKSGGDILNQALAVRMLTTAAYKVLSTSGGDTTVVLPRMTSLMMITSAGRGEVQNFADLVKSGWFTDGTPWPVTLHEGRRAA